MVKVNLKKSRERFNMNKIYKMQDIYIYANSKEKWDRQTY